MSRPNFLFFITDQQRADYLGCAGHPIVKTPNIDGLAAHGTRFDRFYVASPVCMPNRASLLTGRFPSTHGLRHNGCDLSIRANTFTDVLRAGGYRTALIGKSHVQPMTGIDSQKRYQPDELGVIKEAWKADDEADYDQEDPSRYASPEFFKIRTPYYGYDHVDMVTNHSDQCNGHYYQWLKSKTNQADFWRDKANQLPHDYVCPQAVRTPIPEELYPTSFIRDRAIDYINASKGDDSPFFSHCSFPDPHHPFTPPGHYWDMYDPANVPLSPISGHPADHPIITRLRELRKAGKAKTLGTVPFVVDVEETRQAIALTYGMITMIDDAVGAIVTTLERLGLADTTTIIFTSDHGDFMGDHGLMLKSSLHYDGLVRVPLIWCDPGEKNGGTAIDALTSTIDLAPSFLDTAGLAPFHGMQGRSLRPLLHDPKADWRKAVLIEEDGHEAFPCFDGPLRTRSIVTQRHRMSIYDKLPLVELYDLSTDPLEQTNLADTPEGARIRAGLFEEMSRTMMEMCDWSPFPTGRA